MCFKAFTISADVLKIFMQQFWYKIKKVQGINSYEFLLANKKCRVDAEVFRKILDICLRVEGEEFTELQNDDDTLTFLIDLGYKGLLQEYTNIIGEDYQEYGLAIPDIPSKKSRGKGSQGNKTVKDSQETVDVSEESEPELEPVKKKTASTRVVKKKVTISADDNIISDPDVSLEIVTEYVPESAMKKTGSRSSRSVVIQDTPSAPKPKPATSKPKLKGVQSLTPAEKEVADIMQALKETKKTSKRQPGTGGSSEGTGTISGVPDESTLVSTTSNEGTGTKPGVPNEEKVITEEKVILKWGSEQESEYSEKDQLDDEEKDDKEGDADDEGDDHISDTQDTDDEDAETESDEDEAFWGSHFLKLSSVFSVVGTIKDTTYAKINSLFEVTIQFEVPHIQSPSMLRVSVSMISEPSVLTPVQESPSIAILTNLPIPSVSTIPPAPQQTATPISAPPITTNAPTSPKPHRCFEFDTLLSSS
ncbi:hypothetical protein Tco_1035398 [Tanacetum coccineum]